MSVVVSLFYYFLSRLRSTCFSLVPSRSPVGCGALLSKLLSSCANTAPPLCHCRRPTVTGPSNLHCAFNSINIQTSTNALSIIHVVATEEQQHGTVRGATTTAWSQVLECDHFARRTMVRASTSYNINKAVGKTRTVCLANAV
uniref:Putative secreted protein n=1 Tax=Anopheles darlingi TaxID=43151 RepID=A0A2M4DIF1_ANODA